MLKNIILKNKQGGYNPHAFVSKTNWEGIHNTLLFALKGTGRVEPPMFVSKTNWEDIPSRSC